MRRATSIAWLVLFVELARRVGHEHQQVALLQRVAHRIHQALVQLRVGAVYARRIDENDLRFRQGDHALYGRPRGLRLIGDDGHLLAHQCIQQRGFSGVRPADDRDEPRLELCFQFCH